jgi:hypothetical protein
MASNTIITSIVTGGTNSHATVAEEANVIATDFVTQGVVGAITLNSGSGGTGGFCVNADSVADMGVTVMAGQAYISATPSSQDAQVLRARAASDYTAYTINANSSGVTKYDWIYLSVSAANANNPSSAADNVTSIYTSRSSSNTTDNGTPPTYGLLLAIVTVANGASSITNSNITDKRFNSSIGAQNGSLIVTQSATGQPAVIQAAGVDANVDIEMLPKGTGAIKKMVEHLMNPYKFSAWQATLQSVDSSFTTVVTFDTKTFDTGSNYSTSTHKFVAPVAGFYYFSTRVQFNSGTYAVELGIAVNGTVALRGGYALSNAVNGGGLIKLNANDYVTVVAYSATTQNTITGTDPSTTYFNGFLVSAT